MGRTTAFTEPQLSITKSITLSGDFGKKLSLHEISGNFNTDFNGSRIFQMGISLNGLFVILQTRGELDMGHMDRVELIPMKNKSMNTIRNLKRKKQLPENRGRIGVCA